MHIMNIHPHQPGGRCTPSTRLIDPWHPHTDLGEPQKNGGQQAHHNPSCSGFNGAIFRYPGSHLTVHVRRLLILDP